MSLLYLRIIFCGIPATAAYNMFASALRAMGNSKTPLTAMIIASVLNVSLDILFVAGFGWGVAGAAIATVIAQSFSAVYCFLILRRIDIVHLTRADFMPASGMNARLMKLGIPVVFQNIIIGVGGLVVQYVINGYGFLFVAGFTATNKLYGLLEMAAISYGYAIVTYVGQNLGAGKIDRIRKGVRSSMLLSLLTSLIISAAMFLFGKNILSLFISGEPQQTQEVLAIAFKYLSIMAAMLWVLYFLYVYRSVLQGLGDTLMPMVSGMAENQYSGCDECGQPVTVSQRFTQIFEILCPIILGELNRKSLSESCGYSCDNPHQKVNSTQCGKSLHTCNLANNHGIHHCIKLLTDIPQHQGNCKKNDQPSR